MLLSPLSSSVTSSISPSFLALPTCPWGVCAFAFINPSHHRPVWRLSSKKEACLPAPFPLLVALLTHFSKFAQLSYQSLVSQGESFFNQRPQSQRGKSIQGHTKNLKNLSYFYILKNNLPPTPKIQLTIKYIFLFQIMVSSRGGKAWERK